MQIPKKNLPWYCTLVRTTADLSPSNLAAQLTHWNYSSNSRSDNILLFLSALAMAKEYTKYQNSSYYKKFDKHMLENRQFLKIFNNWFIFFPSEWKRYTKNLLLDSLVDHNKVLVVANINGQRSRPTTMVNSSLKRY